MPRSMHGGRHELGQNFLTHRPTIEHITDLVRLTTGPILELGAGDGALTRPLATLHRPLTVIDIDEHRVARLRDRLPHVRVERADALQHPLDAPVIVGNIPFHLTTPVLRRLLAARGWHRAVLLTQWEVARKRAGVGGGTMMTAQSAPWFEFELCGRVAAHHFSPRPAVDGGLLSITRRGSSLVAHAERRAYENFVRGVFTGRGTGLASIAARVTRVGIPVAKRALIKAGIDQRGLPRDLTARQWAALWHGLRS
ncbi:23S ribosomal RNA methyltransferase Erm [Microbacterium sp. H1-D42]|uniref:23S ribosomal RNA methyltransferase Erm n=1 Tax=Microbacterium sp. H1-D42 TaxID=2925844 RepID=UPI001F530184|nr:23S ribosomal RNA methyltransferase Erm [Microbacterium sp. H1-D42]UNK70290.1 23S ribosomal RNA methyltransferase Erm [Microbacterium sp. H1-D42]